jgi:diaminopropionate ammonia-lyase
MREISAWAGYAPTPLKSLDRLAAATGVGQLHYKDESDRFALQSFKALGAPFALARLLALKLAELGADRPRARDVMNGRFRAEAGAFTCAAATDGNHGRALAWAAERIGCRCVVYVHAAVSRGRAAAIARHGAEVVRLAGTYDDAVHRCAEDCRRLGWLEINDGGPPDDLASTRLVMQGYAVLVEEVLSQLPTPPSHVFLQAGVGGFAGAVAARLWQRQSVGRCRVVVVEPERAACVFATAEAGDLRPAKGDLDTVMAGLACGEASFLAWQILKEAAFAFLTIPDQAALDTMRLLAAGEHGAPPIVAGETGAAGLAGFLAAAGEAASREALGIDSSSRILVFGTEGASDPELYARYVTEHRPA